jgi:multidrug resistance efflux pump
MRALVLRGKSSAWEAGPRSAAELKEAAKHFERYVELQPAPALKTNTIGHAAWCRSEAEAMEAAQAAAKAKEMAVAEAKANAAADALLAEEEAEKKAASKAQGKQGKGKKGKGKKGKGGR